MFYFYFSYSYLLDQSVLMKICFKHFKQSKSEDYVADFQSTFREPIWNRK